MGNTTTKLDSVHQKFYENLENLSEAAPILAEPHKKKLLSSIDILTDSEEGIRFLYENIDRLVDASLLADTMWEDPAKLVPALVGGTLKAGGRTTLFEILSELRMLAIYREKIKHKLMRPRRAYIFLVETLVSNLDLVFPDTSGVSRTLDENTLRKIRPLFSVLTDHLPMVEIKKELAAEIEQICIQRPIMTDRLLQIIKIINGDLSLNTQTHEDKRLQHFVDAVYAPSDKAGELTLEDNYKDWLSRAGKKDLEAECRQLAATMRETGLCTGYHALLLRQVAHSPGLIKLALRLDDIGKAELEKHKDFVREIIQRVIQPDTARSCYGLAKLLERSLLSHQPVHSGLKRIMDLDLHPDVKLIIGKSRPDCRLDPVHILAAECLGVLGQPLGIGQGWNPTCQSARGISLWSSHAPGKLLRMIETAAKTNSLTMRFESQVINSNELAQGLVKELDYNLDAVSIVLVPHLDKIYNEMMIRASNRQDDPHKWVNPAMYGHWIPTGFISAYDNLSRTIKDYEKFIRTFYSTHHPDYNGGHNLAYPNPVGIFLTSSAGKLIGFHAVSILRVKKVKGHTRIFMLNPNNEGRQRWQDDIKPTVTGNGERAGESSLPFYQFASRIYAFHFNPGDLGDLNIVDPADVEKVTEISKNSWGASYSWYEPVV